MSTSITGCNSTCSKDTCFGSSTSECCNYYLNDRCLPDCGERYRPAQDGRGCECDNGWVGDDCQVCSLQCQNGGTPDSDCQNCLCQGNYTGDLCQTPPTIPTIKTPQKPVATTTKTSKMSTATTPTPVSTDDNKATPRSSNKDEQSSNIGLRNLHQKTIHHIRDTNIFISLGLIIGLIAGTVVLLGIVLACIYLYRRSLKQKLDSSLSSQIHKDAPPNKPSGTYTSKTDNPLYRPPEEVASNRECHVMIEGNDQSMPSESAQYDSLPANNVTTGPGKAPIYDSLDNL